MTPVLYVIRHGRTSFNQKGLFRGEANIPLAPEGFKDADEALEELCEQCGEDSPRFIVSSDKKRAAQTAEVLGKHFGVDPTESDQLRAWNLGDFSGKPKNKENTEALEQYVDDPNLQVPGGESLNEFRDRILPVLAECFEHATRVGIGFVVAHSSVIHELGAQLHGSHNSLLVKPGGIVVVGFNNGQIEGERLLKPETKLHPETVS